MDTLPKLEEQMISTHFPILFKRLKAVESGWLFLISSLIFSFEKIEQNNYNSHLFVYLNFAEGLGCELLSIRPLRSCPTFSLLLFSGCASMQVLWWLLAIIKNER